MLYKLQWPDRRDVRKIKRFRKGEETAIEEEVAQRAPHLKLSVKSAPTEKQKSAIRNTPEYMRLF